MGSLWKDHNEGAIWWLVKFASVSAETIWKRSTLMLSFAEKHGPAKLQSKFSLAQTGATPLTICKYGSSHWHKPCCSFKKPFSSCDKHAWEAEHSQLRGKMTAKYTTALVKRTKPYAAGRRILLCRQSGNFTVWFHPNADGNQRFCRFSI